MQFFKDAAFDAQWMRTLGHSAQGGAEISECLRLQKRIKTGDYESWYGAWYTLADSLRASSVKEKEPISAGEKLLRASNYYRTAYFFLEETPDDPRIEDSLKWSKEAFLHALEQLRVPFVYFEIPFDGLLFPAFLYLSDDPNAPLIIDTGGGDSTLEELYFTCAAPALKRGYHCLTFEGPGQGSVLRLQKAPFRADWETVVSTVIDFMQQLYPSMTYKIALRGDSFGGYLAARAAAFDSRIAACIVNPGILEVTPNLKKLNSTLLRGLLFFFKPDVSFKIKSRFMRFGVHSFEELQRVCQTFSLKEKAQQIVCPTLVIDNEQEHLTKGQAIELFESLRCEKTYYLFKKEQCTGGHCQPLAPYTTQELIFNWLDDHFIECENRKRQSFS